MALAVLIGILMAVELAGTLGAFLAIPVAGMLQVIAPTPGTIDEAGPGRADRGQGAVPTSEVAEGEPAHGVSPTQTVLN